MSDTDQSLYNLRYNQISQELEGFGGGSPQWTQLTITNVDPAQVPITRQINTTAPLTGGGNLSADRTLAITHGNLTVGPGNPGLVIANGTGAVIGTGTTVNVVLANDSLTLGPGGLGINDSGVTPGSYTNTNLTVDEFGRITAAANGSTGGSSGAAGRVQLSDGAGGFTSSADLIYDAADTQIRFTTPGGGTATLFLGSQTEVLFQMIDNAFATNYFFIEAGPALGMDVRMAPPIGNTIAITSVPTGAADHSALVELQSTTQGFLPPKMTTTERDAISSPAEGLLIYNTTTHKLNIFTTGWEQVTSA